MTPEEINTAVAEFRGWKYSFDGICGWWSKDRIKVKTSELPDYFNDLNALAEAVEELSPDQHRQYIGHCMDLVRRSSNPKTVKEWLCAFDKLKTPQRATALLRTIGR